MSKSKERKIEDSLRQDHGESQYRTTKHVAFKANPTVAELQRMLASWRLLPQNR